MTDSDWTREDWAAHAADMRNDEEFLERRAAERAYFIMKNRKLFDDAGRFEYVIFNAARCEIERVQETPDEAVARGLKFISPAEAYGFKEIEGGLNSAP